MDGNFPVSAQWIWTAEPTAPVNSYVQFRAEFSGLNALLRITVSGNYAAYVNGEFAAFGQYTDYPEHKTYSETDISSFCREGLNELLVEVHYSGNDFSSHTDGDPGLIAEIIDDGHVLAASSPGWLSRIDTRYAQDAREKLFVSLNYNFEFDARRELAEWCHSVALTARGAISKRPVPPLPARQFTNLKEVSRAPGRILYDAGEETTGLLDFELAAHEGTVVEISHAEYLVDGRLNPAATSNGRNFTDRYICRDGANAFFHPLRRFGGRYFELRFSQDVSVNRFGLRHVIADLPTPPFSCSDPVFEKAHELSSRTLRLCLHEKFENCPWREQSICAADARNQMLFGYGFWGNFDRAAAMLDLFAQGVKDNGFIRAAVPMSKPLWIPTFTFHWMLAVHELALYSGSTSVFERHAALIEWMLGKILSTKSGGLWLPPDDPARWDYAECVNLEWDSDPPNAIYNLYLREALVCLAPRFRRFGREEVADRLELAAAEMPIAFAERFWDNDRHAFADKINGNGVREGFLAVVQILALLQGLVPVDERRGLFERVLGGAFGDVALPTMPYLIRLVHGQGTEADKECLHEKIRGIILAHLEAGATTWWEDIRGTGYAGGAGSLCHGWSAFEAWYETAYLLGVRPVADGVYEERPWHPAGMTHCKGAVVKSDEKCKNEVSGLHGPAGL